jgi:methylenetetrahydrofolate dehydrogenase (NADP+) / methenyltetrahydrofolate cyclohydrolase
MTAQVLDGKKLAEIVRAEVRIEVDAFRKAHGRVPGLDVILVGEDPGSQVYTRNKEKASNEVGMRGRLHTLPATATESELLALIATLNADATIDAILVQLPLPKHLNEQRVLDSVRADKDVDGLHPTNAGLLALGRPALVPCTPLGCMRLLKEVARDLKGARAVVVGRSNIVGKPVAQLLLAAHATVTLAHSHTRDLAALTREADVLIAAVGQPELIRGDWVQDGAIVLDIGINRIATTGGATRLVGDVAFDEAKARARAITPVPGGVGPLTIAFLLKNALEAAKNRESARAAR